MLIWRTRSCRFCPRAGRISWCALWLRWLRTGDTRTGSSTGTSRLRRGLLSSVRWTRLRSLRCVCRSCRTSSRVGCCWRSCRVPGLFSPSSGSRALSGRLETPGARGRRCHRPRLAALLVAAACFGSGPPDPCSPSRAERPDFLTPSIHAPTRCSGEEKMPWHSRQDPEARAEHAWVLKGGRHGRRPIRTRRVCQVSPETKTIGRWDWN